MASNLLKLDRETARILPLPPRIDRTRRYSRLHAAGVTWRTAVEEMRHRGERRSEMLMTGKKLLEEVNRTQDWSVTLPLLLEMTRSLESLAPIGLDLLCQVTIALAQTYWRLSNRKQAGYWVTRTLQRTARYPNEPADRDALSMELNRLGREEKKHREPLQLSRQAIRVAEKQKHLQTQGSQKSTGRLESLSRRKLIDLKSIQTRDMVETQDSTGRIPHISQATLYSSAPSSPTTLPPYHIDRSLQVSPEPDGDRVHSHVYLDSSIDTLDKSDRFRPPIRKSHKSQKNVQRLQAWVRGWLARRRIRDIKRRKTVLRVVRKCESGRYAVVKVNQSWEVILKDVKSAQEFVLKNRSREKAERVVKDVGLDIHGNLTFRSFTLLLTASNASLTRLRAFAFHCLSQNYLPITKPHNILPSLRSSSTTDTFRPGLLSSRSDPDIRLHPTPDLASIRYSQSKPSPRNRYLTENRLAVALQDSRIHAATFIQKLFRGYRTRISVNLKAHQSRLIYRGGRYVHPGELCEITVIRQNDALRVNVWKDRKPLSITMRNVDLETALKRVFITGFVLMDISRISKPVGIIQRHIRGFLARRFFSRLQGKTKRKLAFFGHKSLGAEVFHIAIYQFPDRIQVETFKLCKLRQLKYRSFSSYLTMEELVSQYGQEPRVKELFEDIQLMNDGRFLLRQRYRSEEKPKMASRPHITSKRTLVCVSKRLGEHLWVVTMSQVNAQELEFSAYSSSADIPLQVTARLETLANALRLSTKEIVAVGSLAIQRLLKLEEEKLVFDLNAVGPNLTEIITRLQAYIRGFLTRKKNHLKGSTNGLLSCVVVQQLGFMWILSAYRFPPYIRIEAQQRRTAVKVETNIPDTIFSRFPPSLSAKRVSEQFIFPHVSVTRGENGFKMTVSDSILTVAKRENRVVKRR